MTGSVPEWDSFRRGYERGYAIDGAEQRLLKSLAMLRAVWTMSLPAQPGNTWGRDWVDDPAYWVAHMQMVRWFAGAAGIYPKGRDLLLAQRAAVGAPFMPGNVPGSGGGSTYVSFAYVRMPCPGSVSTLLVALVNETP